MQKYYFICTVDYKLCSFATMPVQGKEKPAIIFLKKRPKNILLNPFKLKIKILETAI